MQFPRRLSNARTLEPQAENTARKQERRWCPHLRVNPCIVAQWVSLVQANAVAGLSQAQRNYSRDKLGPDGSLLVVRTQAGYVILCHSEF